MELKAILRKVFRIQDMVYPDGGVCLNLGSGRQRIDGFINVDYKPHGCVDVVCDLNCFPYPFKDNSVDYILMNHVLEHLYRPFDVVMECYRILKNGGLLRISVPHLSHMGAYSIVHPWVFHESSIYAVLGEGNGLQCKHWFDLLECSVHREVFKHCRFFDNGLLGRKADIRWLLKKIN